MSISRQYLSIETINPVSEVFNICNICFLIFGLLHQHADHVECTFVPQVFDDYTKFSRVTPQYGTLYSAFPIFYAELMQSYGNLPLYLNRVYELHNRANCSFFLQKNVKQSVK